MDHFVFVAQSRLLQRCQLCERVSNVCCGFTGVSVATVSGCPAVMSAANDGSSASLAHLRCYTMLRQPTRCMLPSRWTVITHTDVCAGPSAWS
jgi:hypothetical protein